MILFNFYDCFCLIKPGLKGLTGSQSISLFNLRKSSQVKIFYSIYYLIYLIFLPPGSTQTQLFLFFTIIKKGIAFKI